MTLQQAMTIVGSKIPLADDQVKARLNRAYDIVRNNGSGYTLTKSNDGHSDYQWHIHKASTSLFDDSSAFYTVDSQGCNCPDALKCRARLCKHMLAVMLMIEMEKI